MDVTARIEEVIAAKGLTKSKVSERMGKFNQAFNRLIANPKWETIELVAHAIGITTEELLFGNIELAKEPYNEHINKEEGHSKSEIIDNVQQASNQSVGVIICPFCGKGIKLSLEKV